MSNASTIPAIQGKITVSVPLGRAFQVFTEKFDPDPAHASEIEVRFAPEGPGDTLVELEHRMLERLVGGEAMAATISGAGGWSSVLQRFAEAVAEEG